MSERSPGSLLLVERLCWVAGGLLLLVWGLARADRENGYRAGLVAFAAAQEAVAAGSETEPVALADRLGVDFSLWNPKRIALYEESFGHALEVPLAILEIPGLDLRVPVLDGTDELRLNRGVGRIEGTARPGDGGNVGIAGHRDGFFRVLERIAPGDLLRLVTLDHTEVYRVERIDIVQPEDVHVLDPTDHPTVTLVTCYPFYFVGKAPQRFIVRAQLDGPRF